MITDWFPEKPAGSCHSCWGSGLVGNDEDKTPWPVWAAMPPANAVAVSLGIVRPVPCPEGCKP